MTKEKLEQLQFTVKELFVDDLARRNIRIIEEEPDRPFNTFDFALTCLLEKIQYILDEE